MTKTCMTFVMTLSLLAGACAAEDPIGDDELDALEAQLAAAPAVELGDDVKADLPGGITNVKMVGGTKTYIVAAYDKYGYEVTRVSGGRSGSTSYATFSGYGTSVSASLTTSIAANGSAVLHGTVAGQTIKIAMAADGTVSGSGGPAYYGKQATLMSAWSGLVPTVMHLDDDAGGAIARCLGDLAAVAVNAAACSWWNPLSYGFCRDAVRAAIDAWHSCSALL
jgi:hypothetical protein